MISGAPQYRSVFELLKIKINIFNNVLFLNVGHKNRLLLLTVGLIINHVSYRFDDHIAAISLSLLFFVD